jgi:peptidoglycan/xylan/chitin deacetylase (PgdA/CDA1 family)
MKRKKFQLLFGLFIIACIVGMSGCSAPAKLIPGTPKGEPVPWTEGVAPTTSLTPFQPIAFTSSPAPTSTDTLLPTETATPTPTFTPTATHTPIPTATATWTYNEAGDVVAPILLYHHIADVTPINRYYVPPASFREQMQALKDWGFTSITPSYLREVLVNGGDLPNRPILITFDDGDKDVYEYAYPVMHEFGFVGSFYIVSSRIGAEGYVGVDQLKEMAANGWEIGSHTESHLDLTSNHDLAREEMLQSRLDIQDEISVTVTSLAYPYGLVDEFIATKAQEYGYFTGMGLGILTEHTWGTLYYLNRREVHGDMDLAAFAGLLPWSGPILTPTPVTTLVESPAPATTLAPGAVSP